MKIAYVLQTLYDRSIRHSKAWLVCRLAEFSTCDHHHRISQIYPHFTQVPSYTSQSDHSAPRRLCSALIQLSYRKHVNIVASRSLANNNPIISAQSSWRKNIFTVNIELLVIPNNSIRLFCLVRRYLRRCLSLKKCVTH